MAIRYQFGHMPDTIKTAASLDLVVLTPHEDALAILLRRSRNGGRERWELPWEPLAGSGLDGQAERLAKRALRASPGWLRQAGVFAAQRHPGALPLTVGYAAVVAADDAENVADGHDWHTLDRLPALTPRQQQVAESAAGMLRDRVGREPVAFRLLPEVFTLSELQETYELLLGRRLHKASFRRALQGAGLVDATDEWRSEGRGRPAQLFRYAPRKRRGPRRNERFEF